MKRTTRTVMIVAVAATLIATTAIANALWNANVNPDVPDFAIGGVTFSAEVPSAAGSKQTSEGGAAVTVTLPGSTVIKVLNQTTVDAEPVIWRFTASGAALGITGLNYSVAATAQTADGKSHDLGGGIAQPGTVLERSTLKVYRAAAGGDCSAVPATPALAEGETPRNVYLYEADDAVLQAAGASQDGLLVEQEWCAALDWNDVADGSYVNDVSVTALAEDGSNNGATARWHAAVGTPPALELLGTYRNRAFVEGTSEDSTKAKASADWFADVYPDPSAEPNIVLTLNPIVTNLNSAVAPRD